MGGGVGGLLYSSRSTINSQPSTLRYNLSNGRGDIVAQSDAYAALTWTASYEAYGKRTQETGENKDKQRGNSKDEDPTGLLNEGFRYRDIETGVWLSRDPAGFVDGPNLYAYVKQNPWTAFDPDGLETTLPPNLREFFSPSHGPVNGNGEHTGAQIERGMIAVAKANPTRLVVGGHGTSQRVEDSNTGKSYYEVGLSDKIKEHPFYSKAEGILLTSCNTGNTKQDRNPIAARVAKRLGEKEVEAPAQFGYAGEDGTYGSAPAKPGSRERILGEVKPDYSKPGTMNTFDKEGKLVRTKTTPARPEWVPKEDPKNEKPKTSFWQKVKSFFKGKK